MRNVLLIVAMLLMVVSVGFCDRSSASVTDYFGVPTAKILPEGTFNVAIQGVGNEIWGEDNNVGALLDIGVTDRLGVSVTSDLENINSDNLVGGVKFVAGPKDNYSQGGQLALFLYNIGKGRTGVPGLALTVDVPKVDWLSVTASGWYVNDDWQGGAGATATLTENLNLQAEYSSDNKLAFGAGLNVGAFNGTVRYLAETDEFYGMVGVQFKAW